MSDPQNIRLTNFTKGLQTVDKLDYPVDAVRAGSNIDISKHIRTRGGISTVDSVGLPSGSEIMALQQVKFPTNEKTYLIAQVKYSEIVADEEATPGPAVFFGVNPIDMFNTGGGELSGLGYSFDNVSVVCDSDTLIDMDFSSLVDAGMLGIATVNNSEEGYGLVGGQFKYRTYGPYLTFEEADNEAIGTYLKEANTVTASFSVTKNQESGYTIQNDYIVYYSNGVDAQLILAYNGAGDGEGDTDLIRVYFNGYTYAFDIDPPIEYNTKTTYYLAFDGTSVYLSEGSIDSQNKYALYALPDTLPDTGA